MSDANSITLKLNDKHCFSSRFLVLIDDLWNNELVLNLKSSSESTLVYRFKNSYMKIDIYDYADSCNHQIRVRLLCIEEGRIVAKDTDLNVEFNNILSTLYDRYNINNSAINYPLYQILECCNVYDQDRNYLPLLRWREFIIDLNSAYMTISRNNKRVFVGEYGNKDHPFNLKHLWRDYVKKLMCEIEAGTAPGIFYAGLPIRRIKSARN